MTALRQGARVLWPRTRHRYRLEANMSRAAAALRREAELGSLAVGRVADISLIRITEGEFPLTDSEGAVEMARYNLELAGTIRAGQVMAGEG